MKKKKKWILKKSIDDTGHMIILFDYTYKSYTYFCFIKFPKDDFFIPLFRQL